MKIGVLGAGAYGTALGGVLDDNGQNVFYYDPVKGYDNLTQVIDGADYLVLCIPAEASLLQLEVLPVNIPLIIATKGFLSDQLFYRFEDYMVLSGPSFADDIKAKKNLQLTATDKRIIELFKTNYLTFDFTSDRLGVLMCGALKNVYALLAGYLDLQRGTDDWLAYITEVSEEIRALLKANGADPATFDLACGKRDLELTCGLPSRNYEYGQMMRNNPDTKSNKTVEGLSTLKKIKNNEIIIPEVATRLKDILKLKFGGD